MDVAMRLPQPTDFVRDTYQKLSQNMAWIGCERVIDVNCWFGQITRQVLLPLCESRHARIVAVDRAPEAIRLACLRFPHCDIEYRTADISTRQSTPADLRHSFTKVFHFGNPLRTQEQYCALDVVPWLLADGAECIFLLPLRCCVFPVINKLAVCDTWKGYMLEYDHLIPSQYSWQDPVRTFNYKSDKNGLRVKALEIMSTSVTFQSKAEFTDYLSLTIPCVTRIPAEKRPQFLDSAFDLAIRNGAYVEKDGTVVHEMNFLAGLCRKVRDV